MPETDDVLQWLRLLDTDSPGIFWSCVLSITSSTYLTLHLNVPPSYPHSTSSFFLRRWWDARRVRQIRRQALWSLMVVIAPELLVSLAFGDWRASRVGVDLLHKFGRGQVTDWTSAHASFANMGGLVFEMQSEGEEIPDSAPFKENSGHVRLEEIGGEMFRSTQKRLGHFLLSVLQKPFTDPTKAIYLLVMAPLHFLVRASQASFRVIYEKLLQINQRLRGPSRPDLVELDQLRVPTTRLEEYMSAANIRERPHAQEQQEETRRERGEGERTGEQGQPEDERETENSTTNVFINRSPSSPSARPSYTSGRESNPSTDLVMTPAVPASDNDPASGGREEVSTEEDVDDHVVEGGHEHNNPSATESASDDTEPVSQATSVRLHLNSIQIIVAQVFGVLDEFGKVTLDDIEEKSKVDGFSKVLSMLSLLWFSIKMAIKLSRGTAISQLELASCTYVLCALLSYALHWSKAQGVERAIACNISTSDTVRAVTIQDITYLSIFGGSPFLVRNFVPPFGMDGAFLPPTEHIPTDTSLTNFDSFGPERWNVFFGDSDFAGVVAGIGFGALYCLGWYQSFPSDWELWAWRFSAVTITASLIPYSAVNHICTVLFCQLVKPGRSPRQKTHVIHILALYFLLGLYVICRVFMLVQMVRALFR